MSRGTNETADRLARVRTADLGADGGWTWSERGTLRARVVSRTEVAIFTGVTHILRLKIYIIFNPPYPCLLSSESSTSSSTPIPIKIEDYSQPTRENAIIV